MNNNNTTVRSTGLRSHGFNRMLLVTQLLILATALNAFFLGYLTLGESDHNQALIIQIEIMVMAFSGLVIVPSLKVMGKYDLNKATLYYFWVLSVVTSILAFIEGGLYSVTVMSFPIIAIFSALLTNSRMFFALCAFFCLMVVLMAINHHMAWFNGLVTSGTMRMVDHLILVILSAYIAWVINRDATLLLSQLKQDNLEILESKQLMQRLADTDPLTGLANRTFAINYFKAMQSEIELGKQEIGLFFIDLDNFKNINDLFDHQIGDELLRVIAKRLVRLIDPKGLVCRLGGDEFALFIKVTKPFSYEMLAKEILISLSEPHIVFGTRAEITASVGITVVNDRLISFDNTRKQADMAMNKSKQSGKNDFHYYSEDLHRDYMRNLTILSSLKDALSNNLFDLYYQPKVAIESNQVIGVEALIRWNRQNPDNLSPGEFIPVIETTELIHTVGAWVIEQACLSCQRWHEKGHAISIAVNVSALQLARAGFYEVIVNALSVSGLQAHFLEIELTEHFLIQENPIIQTHLKDIKKLGIKLAIDDFGTGYSNMSYLTKMEIDTLKLDRSFISGIDKATDSLAIVKAINEMAVVLGIEVVAEGVEEDAERKLLKKIGCSIGQGFFWSKALPDEELLEYLKNQDPVIVS